MAIRENIGKKSPTEKKGHDKSKELTVGNERGEEGVAGGKGGCEGHRHGEGRKVR